MDFLSNMADTDVHENDPLVFVIQKAMIKTNFRV